MKKIFRNKKAVSPVIATVLMILVTMVGMTLLFAFVSSYSDSYKAGIGSSVMESLTIEDVWFGPRSPPTSNYDSYVNVTIYNSGKIDTTISSAYANGLKLTANNNLNLNKPIAVGQHITLNLKWNQNWVHNNDYTFKISTLRGSNFESTFRVP